MKPTRIALLGATGSIGRQTLEVVRAHPDRFRVVAASAHRRVEPLVSLAQEHGIPWIAWSDPSVVLPEIPGIRVGRGKEALVAMAEAPEVDVVVVATTSVVGVFPTLAGLRAGKRVALANKETLVSFGPVVRKVWQTSPGELVPVDSEHSALFQLWQAYGDHVEELWLTASGGPFRGKTREELRNVTPEEALRHPSWSMGAKITVDSATLMNKALEVIEAARLFPLPPERIQVVIHPQSVIHAMVRLRDGAWFAQLSPPDMRLPIQYALTHPERLPCPSRELAFPLSLQFEEVDHETFPALRMAREALQEGGTAPAILNAANEIAVEAFLSRKIGFLDIYRVVEITRERVPVVHPEDLEGYLAADEEARRVAREVVSRHA